MSDKKTIYISCNQSNNINNISNVIDNNSYYIMLNPNQLPQFDGEYSNQEILDSFLNKLA